MMVVVWKRWHRSFLQRIRDLGLICCMLHGALCSELAWLVIRALWAIDVQVSISFQGTFRFERLLYMYVMPDE